MENKDKEYNDYIEHVHEYGLMLDAREIFFFGSEEGYTDSKSASYIIKNLKILEYNSADPITIHQFNWGGDWTAGMAIYDAIKSSPNEINIICHGAACSMGTIIPQAVIGKGRRFIKPSCQFLIHEGESPSEGNHRKVKSTVNNYEKQIKYMYEIYASVMSATAKSKLVKNKEITDVVKFIENKIKEHEDWILTADEAVYFGLADKVLE